MRMDMAHAGRFAEFAQPLLKIADGPGDALESRATNNAGA